MEDLALNNFSTQRSHLVKSFWAGKLVQKLHLTEDELCIALDHSKKEEEDETTSPSDESQPVRIPVSDALHCLSIRATSLSPRVHSVITSEADQEEIRALPNRRLLHSDCTLDWNEVAKFLDEGCVLKTKDIPEGVKRCSLIAKHVHRQFLENGGLLARLREAGNYSWMSHPLVPPECLSILNGKSELRVNVTILLLTAALERTLGDVFLSMSESRQCPHLLRDLLAKEELEAIFSPIAMFLLCCLIGPPTGLNLRNILWHGFVDHKETPQKYAILLLVLAASLGRLLSAGEPRAIVHRPFVSLSQEAVLSEVFKDLTQSSCHSLKRLFSRSYFILPTMFPVWEAALDAFLQHSYSVCVCLLLPSLEHGLRRVFACVNKCPERAITAEADSLFTTLDEVLNPVVLDDEPNLLIAELGTTKLEMLLDLLVHPEGIRLRDRISHGEVAFDGVSRSVANHVLCLAAVLCAQYSLTRTSADLVEYLTVESRYVSLFHPFSLLRKELKCFQDVLAQLTTVAIPVHWTDSPEHHLQHPHLSHCLLEQLGSSHLCYERGKVREVLHEVWSRVETLFVPRKQLEVVAIMRKAVSNATGAIQQVRETAISRYSQFQKQQLRSRQRANYQVLVCSLPLYKECMEVFVLLVSLVIAELQVLAPPLTNHIKFCKKVLQFTENFHSHCSPTHNCWDEANKLCHSVANLITTHITPPQTTEDQKVLKCP